MKLDSCDSALLIINGSDDVTGFPDAGKAGRHDLHGIAVTHQHRLLFVQSRKKRAGRLHIDHDLTVLRFDVRHHPSAEMLADKLHPIADTEHRTAELENALVIFRRRVAPNARRSSAQNKCGIIRKLRYLNPDRKDIRINARLTDTSVDDLRVLSAAVQNRNFFLHISKPSENFIDSGYNRFIIYKKR